MHALGVLYLDNPEIFHWRMPYYAERVHNKCGLTESVWGLIDGKLHKTCCPSYFQNLMYSGHKRCHGIKFQSIVTPDGLFAFMYGPMNGNWYDSFLLSTSGLLDKLQAFMLDLPGTVAFSLYGDPAYPQSIYIFGGYKIPWMSPPMHFGIQPCQRFVRWWNGGLLTFFLSGLSWISGLEWKSSKVPLPSIILLEHSLWACKLVSMGIKPWFILTVRLFHLINPCY